MRNNDISAMPQRYRHFLPQRDENAYSRVAIRGQGGRRGPRINDKHRELDLMRKFPWLRAKRNAPTRDVALAMSIKILLLLALFALLSRPVFHPITDSAATAAAVAGPLGQH